MTMGRSEFTILLSRNQFVSLLHGKLRWHLDDVPHLVVWAYQEGIRSWAPSSCKHHGCSILAFLSFCKIGQWLALKLTKWVLACDAPNYQKELEKCPGLLMLGAPKKYLTSVLYYITVGIPFGSAAHVKPWEPTTVNGCKRLCERPGAHFVNSSNLVLPPFKVL